VRQRVEGTVRNWMTTEAGEKREGRKKRGGIREKGARVLPPSPQLSDDDDERTLDDDDDAASASALLLRFCCYCR
jgi:hypothetical protein